MSQSSSLHARHMAPQSEITMRRPQEIMEEGWGKRVCVEEGQGRGSKRVIKAICIYKKKTLSVSFVLSLSFAHMAKWIEQRAQSSKGQTV